MGLLWDCLAASAQGPPPYACPRRFGNKGSSRREEEAYLPLPQTHQMYTTPDFTEGPLNQTSWLPVSHQHKCLLDQRQTLEM